MYGCVIIQKKKKEEINLEYKGIKALELDAFLAMVDENLFYSSWAFLLESPCNVGISFL